MPGTASAIAPAAAAAIPVDPTADTLCSHPDTVARFFRALADPTRLRILQFVLGAERTVAECVAEVGISQPRASVHLSCLVDCGYLAVRRDGRKLRYSVGDPRVVDLIVLACAVAADNAAALGGGPRIPPSGADTNAEAR